MIESTAAGVHDAGRGIRYRVNYDVTETQPSLVCWSIESSTKRPLVLRTVVDGDGVELIPQADGAASRPTSTFCHRSYTPSTTQQWLASLTCAAFTPAITSARR